jgi:hypothetical protein
MTRCSSLWAGLRVAGKIGVFMLFLLGIGASSYCWNLLIRKSSMIYIRAFFMLIFIE